MNYSQKNRTGHTKFKTYAPCGFNERHLLEAY